jgi:predicted TIM-barrel fold metal-dependent hydrolase
VGDPVGYRFLPGDNAFPFASPNAWWRKRARFVDYHVWVTPYLEEDLRALADLIGAERILFGSDWPHGEGVAEPLDFAVELGRFSDAEKQRILRDNCLELLGRPLA